jgi:hypothetical protein
MVPRGGECRSCREYVLCGDIVKGCFRRHEDKVGDGVGVGVGFGLENEDMEDGEDEDEEEGEEEVGDEVEVEGYEDETILDNPPLYPPCKPQPGTRTRKSKTSRTSRKKGMSTPTKKSSMPNESGQPGQSGERTTPRQRVRFNVHLFPHFHTSIDVSAHHTPMPSTWTGWDLPVDIPTPPGASDSLPSWSSLKFSLLGIFNLRRRLGVLCGESGVYTTYQHRFRDSDIARFAAGLHADGKHITPPNTFHPGFFSSPSKDGLGYSKDAQVFRQQLKGDSRKALSDLVRIVYIHYNIHLRCFRRRHSLTEHTVVTQWFFTFLALHPREHRRFQNASRLTCIFRLILFPNSPTATPVSRRLFRYLSKKWVSPRPFDTNELLRSLAGTLRRMQPMLCRSTTTSHSCRHRHQIHHIAYSSADPTVRLYPRIAWTP